VILKIWVVGGGWFQQHRALSQA